MVWQVKFVSICLAVLLLLGAACTGAEAATYQPYDGNPSNTYIQYFKDTIPSLKLGDHYVAFRSGQYDYTMAVGNIDFDGSRFSSTDPCIVYVIQSNNSYNGYYSYSVGEIDSFSLDPSDKIIYSDLGNYPQLTERGSNYEVLTTILIVAICVGYVCKSVFGYRPR